VSCTTASDCVAVGDKSDLIGPGDETTLIENRHGTAWSVVPSPNPGSVTNVLNGVTCTAPSNCVAVGYSSDTPGVETTLIERWDGHGWAVTSSPNAAGSASFLRNISCTDSSNCVAVGDFVDSSSGDFQTLIETWNGATWTLTSSPEPGTSSTELLGVSCTSSSRCVAVGWYFDGPTTQGLIETRNGTSWSVTPSPSDSTDGVLTSVSCTSATSCAAVGSDIRASGSVTLGERWDGTSWSVTPTPNVDLDSLQAVSCTSSTSCAAVGVSVSGEIDQTLAEIWNGSAWSLSPSPSPGNNAVLQGVFCTASSRCVAVGQTFHEANSSKAWAELWNGTAWRRLQVTPRH
jgi:hypothetical protein